jgi:glutamyl-tRNA synthetase
LPEALRNYLLRLGWSHGDDEIISTEDAIRWFDLAGINRSPAQFDFAKLGNVNGHYIREADDARLVQLVVPRLERPGFLLSPGERERIAQAMPAIKLRARTLQELADNVRFYIRMRPIEMTSNAAQLLTPEAKQLLRELSTRLVSEEWQAASLDQSVRGFADLKGVKLGTLAQPLRAALTGSLASPGIFEVMEVLGREESLGRIADAIDGTQPAAGA